MFTEEAHAEYISVNKVSVLFSDRGKEKI